MNKLGAAILFLLAGGAHATDQLQTIEVSGLSVPGTPALAKQQHFTECTDGYDKFECRRTTQTKFYGAVADRALLSIDGRDNFSKKGGSSIAPKVSDVPPEKLSYRSIRLDFNLSEREKLEKALRADGWLKSGSMNTYEFVKEGVAASVKMHRSSTTLTPTDLTEVNQQIAGLKAKAAEAAKAESSSSAFIDEMKK
ncbi:hypothetical protein DBR45_41885 [Pseudomonas sp. HMWF031]|nr:hypothetical protein DBR45_41885 [Pseudomonas sp. HMWF031]